MARQPNPKLRQTAEQIGTALGHIAGRVDALKKQRAEIAADIHKLVQSAQAMLNDLGHQADPESSGTRKGSEQKGGRMSPAKKAEQRATWKRDKAAGEKIPQGVHTKPGDVRATIRAVDGRRFTARQAGKG